MGFDLERFVLVVIFSFRIDGGGDSSFESSSSDSDLQALPRDRVDPLDSAAHEEGSNECDTEDELEK